MYDIFPRYLPYVMIECYQQKIIDRLPEEQRESLKTHGYYLSTGIVARKAFVGKVTAADLEEFIEFDSSLLPDRFPLGTHVLTLQGLADRVVPPYDAIIYAQIFGARQPGTHNLCYSEDADHNFTGMSDFVVDTILEWWAQLERGQLQTGIWNTGVRGKL
ncbi:hypothetical protein QCA50_014557 [Cerrena zonata]|uniref:Peptidase S9 prolyl oligopeptidase catalytic domain-containing protein n=1 Tax=Cerrena zonata TaxID=2478898 RepID=A0AAW0FSS6_9APHY